MDKLAFISGFLSFAKQAGTLNTQTRPSLQKLASESYYHAAKNVLMEKSAFFGLGPTSSINDVAGSAIGSMLAANALGAGIGSNYAPLNTQELEKELAYSEDPSIGKALKYLIPGYAGYRMAKNQRLDEAYQNYKDNQKAQRMQAIEGM